MNLIAYIKENYYYDKIKGELIRLKQVAHYKKGDIAGCIDKRDGYRRIKIKNKNYLVHRIIWLMVKGSWPEEQLDHINGIRHDNRLENLREATESENKQNKKKSLNNQSGYIGVTKHGERWQAQIKVDKKRFYLGTFSDPKEAHEAYCEAKSQYHMFQPLLRQGG